MESREKETEKKHRLLAIHLDLQRSTTVIISFLLQLQL